MEINKAAGIFNYPDFRIEGKTNWADLGCGTGTFTLALASLLAPESRIYAIDSNESALKAIPDSYGNADIEKLKADFLTDRFAFENLDGILMANALHYVKDKKSFIQKALKHLTENGCFLLVEYDTDIPNNWVPYPQTFSSLQKLFAGSGFSSIHKLGELPSVYNRAMMYAAIIER